MLVTRQGWTRSLSKRVSLTHFNRAQQHSRARQPSSLLLVRTAAGSSHADRAPFARCRLYCRNELLVYVVYGRRKNPIECALKDGYTTTDLAKNLREPGTLLIKTKLSQNFILPFAEAPFADTASLYQGDGSEANPYIFKFVKTDKGWYFLELHAISIHCYCEGCCACKALQLQQLELSWPSWAERSCAHRKAAGRISPQLCLDSRCHSTTAFLYRQQVCLGTPAVLSLLLEHHC